MKRLFRCISLLFLLIFTVSSVQGYNLIINNAKCDNSGAISYELNLLTSEEGETERVEELVIAAKHNETTVFRFNGTYYDEDNVKVGRLFDFDDYTFVSPEGLFLNNGTYEVKILYDEKSRNVEFEVECPGYDLSCSEMNLKVHGCFEKEGYIFTEFSGIGLTENVSKLIGNDSNKILSKINFTANYNRVGASEYFEVFSGEPVVNQIGSDLFLMQADISAMKNPINSVALRVDVCDFKQYGSRVFRTKTCDAPIPQIACVTDDSCELDEKCEPISGYCVKLNCNACQLVGNHTCVERCDDLNVCTSNQCLSGECVYEPIELCCNYDFECNDDLFCTKDTCEDNTCAHGFSCPVKEDACTQTKCNEEKDVCEYTYDTSCGEDGPLIVVEGEEEGEIVEKEENIPTINERNLFIQVLAYFAISQTLILIAVGIYLTKVIKRVGVLEQKKGKKAKNGQEKNDKDKQKEE